MTVAHMALFIAGVLGLLFIGRGLLRSRGRTLRLNELLALSRGHDQLPPFDEETR